MEHLIRSKKLVFNLKKKKNRIPGNPNKLWHEDTVNKYFIKPEPRKKIKKWSGN